MKRLLLLCLTYIMCVGNHQMAAQDSSESPGIFNSLAVGVSASTTGIGIDVASPIAVSYTHLDVYKRQLHYQHLIISIKKYI